jgi:primosomal replication protein N
VDSNRVELGGQVVYNDGLRHTPAGLASLLLRLAHASEQSEAGHSRRVECELEAVAFGKPAERLAGLEVGARVGLSGFLDRKGLRDSRPILHVTGFELI